MSERKRLKRVRRQRRRCSTIIMSVLSCSFLLVIFFGNYKVVAEKPSVYKYYTEVRIERNDTLWSIADRYMTDEYSSRKEYVKEIQKLNDLGCDLIYGQRILVPYYSEIKK